MCFIIGHITQSLVIARCDAEHGLNTAFGPPCLFFFLFLLFSFWCRAAIVYQRNNRNRFFFIRLLCFIGSAGVSIRFMFLLVCFASQFLQVFLLFIIQQYLAIVSEVMM